MTSDWSSPLSTFGTQFAKRRLFVDLSLSKESLCLLRHDLSCSSSLLELAHLPGVWAKPQGYSYYVKKTSPGNVPLSLQDGV